MPFQKLLRTHDVGLGGERRVSRLKFAGRRRGRGGGGGGGGGGGDRLRGSVIA